MRSSALRWLGLALLGLLVAGAIAFMAVRTVSEKIGISSEPLSAGRALVPKEERAGAKRGADSPTSAPTSTVAPTPAPGQAPAPTAAGGGGGGGDDYAAGGGSREAGDD